MEGDMMKEKKRKRSSRDEKGGQVEGSSAIPDARGGKFNGPKSLLNWLKGEQETTNSSLSPPEGLHIDTLIKSTEEAFEVIVPWCGIQSE